MSRRGEARSRLSGVTAALAALLVTTLLGACTGSEAAPPTTTANPTNTANPTSTANPSSTAEPGSTNPSSTAEPGSTGTPTTPAPAAGTPTSLPPAPPVAPAAWSRCGRLDCATVTVPLDWANPTGPTIGIAMVRLRATGDRIGSLFVNPGGPGGSGTDFVANAGDLFSRLQRRFDIVGFDPRGVGRSNPLSCGSATVTAYRELDQSPDTPEETAALDRAAAAISTECAATDGPRLAHMTTAEVARDLDALRQAVGDGQLNLLGYSYGTAIGQWYAHLFPNQVRAIVADGVVDPARSLTEGLEGQAAAFTASLEAQDRACARNRNCPVPIIESLRAVTARVETAPLPTDTGRPLGPAALGTAVIATAYTPNDGPRLSAALAEGLSGRGTKLLALADEYNGLVGFAAYAAVSCSDGPVPRGAAEFDLWARSMATRWPLVGAAVANELRTCATWPAANRSTPTAINGEGAPPLLLIANTGDPATPYAGAVTVAARLRGSRLVTVESDGHTAYGGGNRCVEAAVEAYLERLELPPERLRCRAPAD